MKSQIAILILGIGLIGLLLAPTVSAQTGTITPTATAQATEPSGTPQAPTTAATDQTATAAALPATATIAAETPTTVSATITTTATVTKTVVPPVAATTGGLRPEDVTFGLFGLANQVTSITVPGAPYDNSGPPGPVGAPAHLAYEFDGAPRLWVIPTEAYQAQWNAAGDETISANIAKLRTLLRDKPKSPGLPLPFLPPIPATNDVAGRVRYLDFNGGSGIAYLGRWAQDASPVLASQILYSFVGLTNDGKNIVSFQYPANTSFLPDDISELLPEHLAYIQTYPNAYLQQTSSLLDTLPNSAYGPDLSRLDGLVFSITIPSTGGPQPTPTPATPTPEGTAPAPTQSATADAGGTPAATIPADGGATPAAPTPGNELTGDYQRLLASDWKWVEMISPTETLTVTDPSLYTIRFNNANGFGITADCNIGAGNYTVNGSALTIKDIQSTLVFCGEQSLDQMFTAQLLQAAGYSFEGENLLIQLKGDGGHLKFKR